TRPAQAADEVGQHPAGHTQPSTASVLPSYCTQPPGGYNLFPRRGKTCIRRAAPRSVKGGIAKTDGRCSVSRLAVVVGLVACSGVAAADPGAEVRPVEGLLARLGTSRFQNVGRTLSVAYAPGGRVLASAAWDGSLRLWEPATGKLLREWAGHDGWVKSVAFAPDGKLLASGGKDGWARLWDAGTGREVRRLKAGAGEVKPVAFAADGQTLATVSWDERARRHDVRLWDPAAGTEKALFQKLWAGTVVASPGGKFLAVGRHELADWEQRIFRLWDVATGKELRQLRSDRHMFSA